MTRGSSLLIALGCALVHSASATCYYTSYVDGYCDSVANTAECDWDGGDCCGSTCIDSTYTCEDYAYYQDCQDPDATEYVAPMYPDCDSYYSSYVGDGHCDSSNNIPDCGWDGGDCCNSTCVDGSYYACDDYSYYQDCQDPDATDYEPPMYPDCTVYLMSYLGDGQCDGDYYNVDSCGWDGGDCCNSTCTGSCYSFECLNPDATDYDPPISYPDCTVYNTNYLGDGDCDGSYYNVESCGWDGGDCCNSTCTGSCYYGFECLDPDATDYDPPISYPYCNVWSQTYLGDGDCDGGDYNVASCGWDGGDCCNSTCVPNTYSCTTWDMICLDPTSPDYNPFAAWPGCDVSIPSYIGDGYCDGGLYNVLSCGFDGGDCCNSTCTPAAYSCSATFDCLDPSAPDGLPFCDAAVKTWVGDGYCDGGDYNTPGCDWDGGDCCTSTCVDGIYNCNSTVSIDSMNCLDPFGTIDFICLASASKIGDGTCDSSGADSPNTFVCGWDGGDCCSGSDTSNCRNPYHSSYIYASCNADIQSYIGDGYCDMTGGYNTPSCGWDGGDCCSFSCTDTLIYTCGDGGYDCKDTAGSGYTTISFLYTSSSMPSISAVTEAVQSILGLSATDIVSVNIRALTANSEARRLQETTTYRITIIVVTGNNNFYAAVSKLENQLPGRLEDESAVISSGAVLDASGTVDPDGNEPDNTGGIIAGVVIAVLLVAGIIVAVVVVTGKRGKSIDTGGTDNKPDARAEQYKTEQPASTDQGTAAI